MAYRSVRVSNLLTKTGKERRMQAEAGRILNLLEFLLLNCNEELSDTFQSQFITLDQDSDGISHEFGGHLQNVVGQSSRQDDDLCRRRQVSVNVVNLVLETFVEEFVGFIEDEHLDVLGSKSSSSNHIEYSTGSTGNDVLPIFELLDILSDTGTTDTGVALNVHIISQRENDVLNLNGQFTSGREDQGLTFSDRRIDRLENRDTEGGGLTGTGLRLSDDIPTGNDRQNSSLLDSRGLFEVCMKNILYKQSCDPTIGEAYVL